MTALFEQRVDWSKWAENAAPRTCEAQECSNVFRPNHPRTRFCRLPGCSGRRAAAAPRQRRPSDRAQAAARAVGIQGFLGEVLVVSQSVEATTVEQLGYALVELARAERRGDRGAAKVAATTLCALCAAKAIQLAPPATGH